MTVAILVTARLKSTRLPQKVIKPIAGRPMICHMLDRLKLAQRPDSIIICTSDLAQDDPLERIAAEESVRCFRGHPDDVLKRLTDAARDHSADTVINCTADNPLVDPEYIDRLVDFHEREGNDYSKSEGLPFGAFAYALSYPAMVRACELTARTDTEVWGGYFTETGEFKTGTLQVDDPRVRRPDLRVTVDTPEDFEFMERIFEALYVPGEAFSLEAVVRLCDEQPELRAINAHVRQKSAKPIRVRAR